MHRFSNVVVTFTLFAGAACAQSHVTGSISGLTIINDGPIQDVPPQSFGGIGTAFVTSSQLEGQTAREKQLAHVAGLRKEIVALEAKLIDPRLALRDSITALTSIESELVDASISVKADTELIHAIIPFVSALTAMRDARMRQLSTVEVSVPVDADAVRAQLLSKRDELRNAESWLNMSTNAPLAIRDGSAVATSIGSPFAISQIPVCVSATCAINSVPSSPTIGGVHIR